MKFFFFFILLTIFWQACDNTDAIQKEVVIAHPTDMKRHSYTEKYRPQFHFSPPEKWMNDPNGMVYYEGEYHLFYQYYPDSTVWGPMHWGHAISTDLVHWEHLPIALYPDKLGYIFSGSAVVDWMNTSGFGENGQPPLIAIYTYHDIDGERGGRSDFQYQAIAYSNDKGRTWTKYEGNPVIPNDEDIFDFRDPKVSWHEAKQRWVMILAANDRVKIYTSPNLKNWTFASDFGVGHGSQARPWECPDLFELTADDGTKKWVMIVSIGNRLVEEQAPNGGSGTMYFVGDFDGKTFTNDENPSQTLWLDYGRDNYAGVTYADIPENDGRTLFIGWMSNWDYAQVVPTEEWRSAMTLARTLHLKKTKEGYRVFAQPVQTLSKLRMEEIKIPEVLIDGSIDLTEKYNIKAGQTEILLAIDLNNTDNKAFGIGLSNNQGEHYQFGFDPISNIFFSDRTKSGDLSFSEKFASRIHTAPRIVDDTILKLHIFIDAASIEVFADEGATVITDIMFPTEGFSKLVLSSYGGSIALKEGKVYPLKGIWK